jgi:hypothetical protein
VTDAELDDLARRFDALTLSKPEWTHTAHLAVGLWFVSRYGPEDALARLRVGIRRLNEIHGTNNSATSGYHETVTRAYVQLLAAHADRYGDDLVGQRFAYLLTSQVADKQVLLRYYSRPLLESVAARLGWVEPDIAPLTL